MEIDLIAEGVKVMILGMGTVFVFLLLMIVFLQIQSKIIDKFFPAKITPVSSVKPTAAPSSKPDNKKVVAAIMGAVQAYQNKNA